MTRNKKNGNGVFFRFSLLVLVMMGGLLSFLFYEKISDFFDNDRDNNFTMYPGFGIYIPNDYNIHGIDVSRYQRRINWGLVRQMRDGGLRLQFAFMKATEGTNRVDEQFARNWKKSKEARLVRGAYHFFIASRSGRAQAQNFIQQVKLSPGDLPPVLDVETTNGSSVAELQKAVAEWLQIVEAHYGVKPIIYSNASFYNHYLHDRFSAYPLWVAHYFEQEQPRVTRHWYFWQHNEKGRVNGISGSVDFNVFNGDSTDFKQLLIK